MINFLGRLKFNTTEMFLGLGIGLGYMTSLRFLGPVGVSEIFILLVLIILSKSHALSLLSYEKNLAGYIKLYMLASVFIVMPATTIITLFYTAYKTAPEYIVSYMMGVLLSFLIVTALRKNKIDMKRVVMWFAIAFIISNLIAIFFIQSSLETVRFVGFAKNPNQVMFYASCLSLLLVIYQPRLSWFIIPVVIWITMKTGSDAYILTLFAIFIVYLFLLLFFSRRFSFRVSIGLAVILLGLLSFIIYIFYSNEIIEIWIQADEGYARTELMWNALLVSLTAPFTGYGAGSFSHFGNLLINAEAHNTYLDFSMQFGMIFPVLIYFVFFSFFLNRIKNGFYMQAAFVAAFIISGLFHFTGRHFFFWVEFAIFFYYIFYYEKKTHMTNLDVQK